jgi:large subunit ribosomal protein L1
MPDLTAADMDAAVRTIAGSAPAAWASPWRASNMASFPSASKGLQGKVDRNKLSGCRSADAGQGMRTAKFDESIDVAVNLGVDPRKVRPTGSRFGGAACRYRQDRSRCRVRPGRKGEAAKAAGADIVGFDDLAAESRPAT